MFQTVKVHSSEINLVIGFQDSMHLLDFIANAIHSILYYLLWQNISFHLRTKLMYTPYSSIIIVLL